METVFFKGFGLIGSSLARAIRATHPAVRIVASDPNPVSRAAGELVDEWQAGFAEVEAATVVVLASPVTQICADLRQLATLPLAKGTIVTDVGSTKQGVLAAAQTLLARGIAFVGGHPMAGAPQPGAANGRADLFSGARFFQVVPAGQEAAAARLRTLFAGCGCQFEQLTAAEHDRLVALLSHLPHLLASTLMNQAAESLPPDQLQAAAGGFRSTTRIAAADPAMWTAIMEENTPAISAALAQYQEELARIQAALQQKDWASLNELFAKGQANHRRIERKVP